MTRRRFLGGIWRVFGKARWVEVVVDITSDGIETVWEVV